MQSSDKRFLVILYAMVLAIVIPVLILIIAPSEVLSLLYFYLPAIFFLISKEMILGKLTIDSKPISKGFKRGFILATLFQVVGGLYAFVNFWLTKDHFSSLKILEVFGCFSLLMFILAGGRVSQRDGKV